MLHRLRAVALALILATGVAAAAQPQQAKTGDASRKPAVPRQVHGIKPERVQGCVEAAEHILKQLREDVPFSDSDVRMQRACRIALAVSDVNLVAASPLPEHKKHIKLERFQKAEEVSARVLAEFNERGEDAAYPSDDLEILDTFRMALLAMDTAEKTASRVKSKGVAAELVQSARQAAQHILAQFNEQGYEAKFSPDDEEQLRDFHNALPENKDAGSK